MTSRHCTFSTDHDDRGQRLDWVVHRHLGALLSEPVSRAEARRLVEARRVRVDGRSVSRCSFRVREQARIDVDLPPDTLARLSERAVLIELEDAWVVHEDDALLVVNKPCGVLSDATRDPRRDHLVAAAGRWLEQRGQPATVRAVHRLDADTSGLLVLAKTRKAAAILSQDFEQRRVYKTYTALVALLPLPPRSDQPGAQSAAHWTTTTWTMTSYLAHRQGRTRSVRSGGAFAETAFQVIEHGANWAHVQARPLTGRTHQIRVHAADSSAPILGDPLYAPASVRERAARLMLHASALELVHPVRRAPLTLQAPMPADMQATLAELRAGA